MCLISASPPLPPQLHGRSREQRYTKLADWEYIAQCAKAASPMPLFGGCPEAISVPLPLEASPFTRLTHLHLFCPDGGHPMVGITQSSSRGTFSALSGNGDILSYEDANRALKTGVAGVMIAR